MLSYHSPIVLIILLNTTYYQHIRQGPRAFVLLTQHLPVVVMIDDQIPHSWALGHGVSIDGVTPATLPGRGRGIVATKALKKDTPIIHVPVSQLLTADRSCGLPPELLVFLGECSVHGQLAGRLCYLLATKSTLSSAPSSHDHHDSQGKAPWMNVMPKQSDFAHAMPLLWPPNLQALLPEGAQKLFGKQQAKHGADLAIASKKIGFLSRLAESAEVHTTDSAELASLYTHAWLLVNSRCFYWDYPFTVDGGIGRKPASAKRKPKRDRDDCMAMCPFIDCFNHSDREDCQVIFNNDGFTVKCLRDVELGEEIFISYGKHSNDFLLVEYGFIMDANTDDHAILDASILAQLSELQREALEEHGFLGNFIIDAHSGICHRTQVALRIMLMPQRKWERFVRGTDDGEKDKQQVDEICQRVLLEYRREVEKHIEQVGKAGVDASPAADVLKRRWTQIRGILDANLSRD